MRVEPNRFLDVGDCYLGLAQIHQPDMDRHRVTAAISETRIFATLHEALAAVRGSAPETPVDL
jgi:hypothetical protein